MSGYRRASIAFLIASIGIAPASSVAGLLDPTQFKSLGTLSITTPGTYLISGTSLIVGTTIYTGVNYNGTAVFDFDSINVAGGVTLRGAPGGGSLPIALLSRSDATINGLVDVSANGTVAGAGAGNTGVGGNGGFTPANPPLQPFGSGSGGGGGGFGGAGGAGGGPKAGAGGAPTSTPLFVTLQGGSGGGSMGMLFGQAPGGGGGGAIEIGASRTLTIGGEVAAIGGDGSAGGGGSGGGIALDAPNVLISGTLDAHGGVGAPGNTGQAPNNGSGGGGGGQIYILYSSAGSYQPGTMNVNGGAGGAFGGQSGTGGVMQTDNSLPTAVPEPSSLILLGTSTLGLLGGAALRRRRAGRVEPHPSR